MDNNKLSNDNDDSTSYGGENADDMNEEYGEQEEDNFEEDDDDEGDEDEDEDEDDEDEDDDDDDDDDGEFDEEMQIVAEINKLQDELSHNPYDYDKHVLVISKLKMLGEFAFDSLRSAREKMNKVYPLSPKQWYEWIQDEIRRANDSVQRLNVLQLFERAVAEYLDMDLWIEYVRYAKNLFIHNSDIDLRKILDKSLIQAGLHIPNGIKIWEEYIVFEMDDLQQLYEANGSRITHKNSNILSVKIHRIYDLYCRQLSIPLKGMEQAYSEFENWLNSYLEEFQIDENFKNDEDFKKNFLLKEREDYNKFKTKYEKALKKLKILEEYENKIYNSDSPHYQQYLEYLEFEKKNDDLARIQCLFERAITDNCLQSDLWLDYLKFCDSKLVVADILLPIYKRAVRNCFWIEQIWIRYMEAVERVEKDKSPIELKTQVASILEVALKNIAFDYHRNLWLTYLHCARRQTNKIGWNNEEEVEKFLESFKRAINQLEAYQGADYCYDIYKYYAKVEAQYCKNLQNGRNIWNEFLNKSNSLKYQANTWLDYSHFELLYGDNEHFRVVLLKGMNVCMDYPESIGERLLRFEQENSDDINQYYTFMIKYEKAMKKINEKRNIQSTKTGQFNANTTQTSIKRKSSNIEENQLQIKKKKSEQIHSNHGKTIQTDESKRDETIFVSNLDFEVDEIELKEIFSQFGQVREVRLVRNYKGRSKGFGYIEFERTDSVRKALAQDRMLIRQRPAYISEMDKRKSFQYGQNKEENKLFIKNISPEITKDMLLERVFPEYRDSIINARLVTFRNGYSKGIAYVDMKDAETAAKAIKEKDGFQLGDRKLIVAISDPSKSTVTSDNNVQTERRKSLNTTAKSTKLVSMVPYSVMKSKPSKVKLQVGKENQSSKQSENVQTSDKRETNLNNEEFRSMFIKI